MMDKFSGYDLKVIQGQWSDGDNFNQYLANLDQPQTTPEQAARDTWSGKQASIYGYTEVTVVSDDFHDDGTGKDIRIISIEFRKP